MVKCDNCEREMTTAKSCTFNRVVIFDDLLEERNGYDRRGYDPESRGGFERCPDCGVKKDGIHHYGCDNERCPSCSEQIIGCDCRVEAIIDDKKPIVINFTEKSPEEYIRILREGGIIQF